MPARKPTNVTGDVHPQLPPCTNPTRRAPIPNDAIGTLTRSTLSPTSSPVLSPNQLRPAIRATRATGTLMRKTARQPNPSTSNAPSEGAKAAANPLTAPQTPMARIRFSIGNAARSRARPAGYCAAPPMDWTTLAPMSRLGVEARPDNNDPNIKAASPHRNTFFRP